jgi:hypothetical protein
MLKKLVENVTTGHILGTVKGKRVSQGNVSIFPK